MNDSTYHLTGRFLEPNAARGKYLKIVLSVSLYVLVFKFFVHLAIYWKYDDFRPNVIGTAYIEMFASIIGLIPNSVLPIMLMVWMARAYHNLHRAGLPGLNYSPGWAIGAWFVPIMNFWRPYAIMKEIFYRTQTAFRPADYQPLQHGTVKMWWILYLAPLPVGFIAAISIFNASLPHRELMKMITTIPILPTFFQFFSTLVLISVIRRITLLEERFRERFETAKAEETARVAQLYRTNGEVSAGVENSWANAPADLPFYINQMQNVPEESKILAGEFTDTKGLAKTMIGCLCILLAGTFIVGISDIGVMTGDGISETAHKSYHLVLSLFMLTCLLTVPVLLFTFISWINRSYNNLKNLRVNELSMSSERLAIWWAIPIANLFFAWMMLREIKKHSQIALTEHKEEPDPLPLLDWTWFAFILAGLFMWLVSNLTGDLGYTGRDAGLAMILAVSAYALFVFGFISSIIVTTRIQKYQDALFERVENAVDADKDYDYLKTVV